MDKVMAKMTTGTSSSLGQLIRSERLKQGKSQRQLADDADLAPSILSKLERGQQVFVRDETLEKLADVLDLDEDELRTMTRSGPDIATDLWGDDDYLVCRVHLELTEYYNPSEPDELWPVLGLLMSSDWRIRRAAVTSLTIAALNVVAVDTILRVLSFIAENDTNIVVGKSAEIALNLLSKPHHEYVLSQAAE
jgi:transcriptional regulator with XRE-family HTH domain